MRRHGCHPLNPPSVLVSAVLTVMRAITWVEDEQVKKGKTHFGLSGGPVFWLLLTQVWPSHLRIITFTKLTIAHCILEVTQGQKATRKKIWKTFMKTHDMHQSALQHSYLTFFRQGRLQRGQYLTLSETQQQSHLHLQGAMIRLHYVFYYCEW